MQIIFRIDDSDEMEQAVTGLIELLKTKGGFHGVRTDGGLMIRGKRGWKKVRPVEPWSSPTNDLFWKAMLDKLYMEHYVFRWWAYGGMYSLYYNKPDRYWSLSYEGDQFSMHKVQNNGVIGAHILNMMLNLGGTPHLHIEESPGLAWTDVDDTKAGQRIREQRLAQQSADRQRQQAAAAEQRAKRQEEHCARQLAEQAAAQQRRAERKAANAPQRNPLLDRLAADLMEQGYNYKNACNEARSQLDQAEKEARQVNKQATARQQQAEIVLQQVAPLLAAQQNPLLVRLTEELITRGRSPRGAFEQVTGQLNRNEKEAYHLNKMFDEQAAAQSRREERAHQHAIHQAQDKANHLAWLAQDKERHAAA